jgi:hypothetical protein
MPKRIQIDDTKQKDRKQHLESTIQPLRGKMISALKEQELLLLVENICYQNRVCDQEGMIL